MQEGQVRGVEQVLDQQQIVRLDVQIVAAEAPFRIVEPVEVLDQAGISLRRVAGPDPDPVVLLDDRVGLHFRRGRDAVLAGDLHAGARGIELQAVIRAMHDVADQLAHRELRLPMAAAVLERDGLALDRAIQHDRLVEDDAPDHAASDLVIPGGDVPGVANEHDLLLQGSDPCPFWQGSEPDSKQYAGIAQGLIAVDEVELLGLDLPADLAAAQAVAAPGGEQARLPGAEFRDQQIGAHHDHRALHRAERLHVGHQAHGAGGRHLRPGLAGAKAVDAVLEPAPIVEEHRDLAAGIARGLGARHPDHAAFGVELEPLLEAPLVEQPRLALEQHAALLAHLQVADLELDALPVREGLDEIGVELIVDVAHDATKSGTDHVFQKPTPRSRSSLPPLTGGRHGTLIGPTRYWDAWSSAASIPSCVLA